LAIAKTAKKLMISVKQAELSAFLSITQRRSDVAHEKASSLIDKKN